MSVDENGAAEDLSKALAGINSLVDRFRACPYSYLYESDLQAELFSILRERLPGTVSVEGVQRKEYVLRRVYTEYLDRIDVVCLETPREGHNGAWTVVDQGQRYDTHIYGLPVLLAIELKYVTMGYRKGFDILEDDCRKLERLGQKGRSIGHWIVMGFCQDRDAADALEQSARSSCGVARVGSVKQLDRAYIVRPDGVLECAWHP